MAKLDEAASIYNGHFELEILIDGPVVQVWTPLLDDTMWVTNFDIEAVSGKLGAVGFITRVSLKNASELGTPLAHHHYCKVIKVVPERQLVLKTYSEEGGSYGMQITAFDDTRLLAVGDRTKVTFNFYMQASSEGIAKDPGTMNLDASRDGMMANLHNLKRIVEGH